jgi:hypothetical protein
MDAIAAKCKYVHFEEILGLKNIERICEMMA